MGFLLLLFVILFFFHREIFFALVKFLTRASSIDLGTWALPLLAQLRSSSPIVFLCHSPLVETLSLRTFFGSRIFVQKDLWENFTDEEKEVYLSWALSINLRLSSVERVFFKPDVHVIDRDIIVLASKPLTFKSLLEKITHYRSKHPPTAFGIWISGLSFLGPSLLGSWPDLDTRMKSIAGYLADLKKSQ